ncbi:hypothetical protein F4679DRAFT_591362 [Xylaria curta]|nr:hypothetical protein F4679DRAFT_591362 [Xylaria curta]
MNITTPDFPPPSHNTAALLFLFVLITSPRQLSTLYSHIIRRPLSRALPRIPRRSSTWSCDNIFVGRGATTPLSFASTAATATESVSYDASFPAPTLRRVQIPLLPSETDPSRPIYKIPPETATRAVEIDEPDATLSKGVELGATTVTDDIIENKKEGGGSVEGAAASPLTTTVEDIKHIEEQHTPDEIQQNSRQVGVDDKETDAPLSRRIHILGFTAHARFLAHAVASTPDMPISIFALHRKVMSQWGEENRRLSLYDGQGRHISSTAIPCPERIPRPNQYNKYTNAADYFLDNVIVDTGASIPAMLEALRDRIDRQTTICLLHPGLGLVEELNEHVFTDPDERPNFVLGHSTHRVGKGSRGMYSMKQKQQGTLYLHGLPRPDGGSVSDKSSIAYEAMRQSQHLTDLLSSTETLNVVGLPWVRFLSWKLPRLIFGSAADSISVIMGCKYKDVYPNRHARALWDSLLDETISIISQLPELQEHPHRIRYFTGNGFRRKLRTSLWGQGNNTSPWVKQVRLGQCPPVDYFNGYIIQRAEELGLEHKYNSMAAETVKARVIARQRELRSDLLSTSPYMMDADAIGGGQPPPSLEDMLELELEDF